MVTMLGLLLHGQTHPGLIIIIVLMAITTGTGNRGAIRFTLGEVTLHIGDTDGTTTMAGMVIMVGVDIMADITVVDTGIAAGAIPTMDMVIHGEVIQTITLPETKTTMKATDGRYITKVKTITTL